MSGCTWTVALPRRTALCVRCGEAVKAARHWAQRAAAPGAEAVRVTRSTASTAKHYHLQCVLEMVGEQEHRRAEVPPVNYMEGYDALPDTVRMVLHERVRGTSLGPVARNQLESASQQGDSDSEEEPTLVAPSRFAQFQAKRAAKKAARGAPAKAPSRAAPATKKKAAPARKTGAAKKAVSVKKPAAKKKSVAKRRVASIASKPVPGAGGSAWPPSGVGGAATPPTAVRDGAFAAQPPARAPNPPVAAKAAPATGKQAKFENALSYLDSVKQLARELNAPGMYQEFLNIMKSFKSGAIDTPGVIEHVRALFEDYPHMLVGFNAFLPEGLRMPDVPTGEGARGGEGAMPATTGGSSAMEQRMLALEADVRRLKTWKEHVSDHSQPRVMRQLEELTSRMSALDGGNATVAPMSDVDKGRPAERSAGRKARSGQELEHARSYVRLVKKSCPPENYREFLRLLVEVKRGADMVDAPRLRGVVESVRELFADRPDLFRGFLRFLPETVAAGERVSLGQEGAESDPVRACAQEVLGDKGVDGSARDELLSALWSYGSGSATADETKTIVQPLIDNSKARRVYAKLFEGGTSAGTSEDADGELKDQVRGILQGMSDQSYESTLKGLLAYVKAKNTNVPRGLIPFMVAGGPVPDLSLEEIKKIISRSRFQELLDDPANGRGSDHARPTPLASNAGTHAPSPRVMAIVSRLSQTSPEAVTPLLSVLRQYHRKAISRQDACAKVIELLPADEGDAFIFALA